jgi:hypothetical protein
VSYFGLMIKLFDQHFAEQLVKLVAGYFQFPLFSSNKDKLHQIQKEPLPQQPGKHRQLFHHLHHKDNQYNFNHNILKYKLIQIYQRHQKMRKMAT